MLGKEPDIIQTIQVIDMVMGKQHRMNERYFLSKQCEPQFRWRVDEDTPLRHGQHNTATIAVIAGIRGVTDIAIAAEHRYASRCASSQKCERTT